LNPVAARALAGAFDARQVVKRYLAFVRGWPEDDAFVDHPLRPDDSPPGAVAQPAQTRVRTLVRVEIPEPSDARFATTRAALIEATPVTGRRHQIRRHLKHIAHPIVGDATHGKGPLNRWWADRLGIQRLWLHAQSIEFNADGARSQEASSGVAWSAIDARLAVDERALEHEPGRQWSELWRALAPFAVDSRREVGPY
jgi:tRNA pseudouridine65 synthase